MSHIATDTGRIAKPPPFRKAAGEVTRRKNKSVVAERPPTIQEAVYGSALPNASRILNGNEIGVVAHDYHDDDLLDFDEQSFATRRIANNLATHHAGLQDPVVESTSDRDLAWEYKPPLSIHLSPEAVANLPRVRKHFLNGEGIHLDVLRHEIRRFLGPEAYTDVHRQITHGLELFSARPVHPVSIQLLKASHAYVQESSDRKAKGLQSMPYSESKTYQQRNATWGTGYYSTYAPADMLPIPAPRKRRAVVRTSRTRGGSINYSMSAPSAAHNNELGVAFSPAQESRSSTPPERDADLTRRPTLAHTMTDQTVEQDAIPAEEVPGQDTSAVPLASHQSARCSSSTLTENSEPPVLNQSVANNTSGALTQIEYEITREKARRLNPFAQDNLLEGPGYMTRLASWHPFRKSVKVEVTGNGQLRAKSPPFWFHELHRLPDRR
ncbi:uncharacterized protein KY384_002997 [Bacidia gigantensis]|uniref:uncharacterized protein n=1 Tax=Bacidia gigantensis TaxID=2732470 RepID=UPI001D0503B2|nr:uncharacterized protein KY384_002997 [Bacidia gigantensis]KAG8531368.1 hypothetical protein KY384_002997 [Bacidia gigantensis]